MQLPMLSYFTPRGSRAGSVWVCGFGFPPLSRFQKVSYPTFGFLGALGVWKGLVGTQQVWPTHFQAENVAFGGNGSPARAQLPGCFLSGFGGCVLCMAYSSLLCEYSFRYGLAFQYILFFYQHGASKFGPSLPTRIVLRTLRRTPTTLVGRGGPRCFAQTGIV